jgi:hypothetical protein
VLASPQIEAAQQPARIITGPVNAHQYGDGFTGLVRIYERFLGDAQIFRFTARTEASSSNVAVTGSGTADDSD